MGEMMGFNEVEWLAMFVGILAFGIVIGLAINQVYKQTIEQANPEVFCDAYWNISMCIPPNISKENLSNMTMELLEYSANHTWRKNSSLMNACNATP